MPLGNEIGKFLWNVAEQKNGFSFGKPWRNSDTALGLVIPIIRDKDIKRKYRMYEEMEDKIEIEDTGDVNTMRLISKADVNVFIRSGVILSGAGQTRATVSGKIVMPNTTEDLEVKCVYASKPTHKGAKMKQEDYAPPIVMQSLYKSQRDTWNSVQDYATSRFGERPHRSMRLGFSGSNRAIGATISHESLQSDDLLGTMKKVEQSQQDVEDAIKDIPVQKNQVGAIIFDIDSIVGFEVFDSPESWEALHKKVIKKYDEVLRKEQEKMVFELKPEVIPEKISEFVEELMKSNETKHYSNKESNTFIIDGEKQIGEYTTINSDIIHLIAFKRN